MHDELQSYWLPRGPFFHGDELEITEANVNETFPALHESAQQDYLRAGLVAPVPPPEPEPEE